jgi:hypothetical protein
MLFVLKVEEQKCSMIGSKAALQLSDTVTGLQAEHTNPRLLSDEYVQCGAVKLVQT